MDRLCSEVRKLSERVEALEMENECAAKDAEARSFVGIYGMRRQICRVCGLEDYDHGPC